MDLEAGLVTGRPILGGLGRFTGGRAIGFTGFGGRAIGCSGFKGLSGLLG